jgi:hypothetical protein
MTSLKKLDFQLPEDLTISRFPDLKPGWKKAENSFGDLPEVDYACSQPSRRLDQESLEATKEVIEENRHLACSNARAVTLRGALQLQKWFGCAEQKKVVSKIAGVELTTHIELNEEGESILVQGPHVIHMAEKAKDGNRITLIVSFAPKSLDYRDTTRIPPSQSPYFPSESLGEQAIQHRFSRLSRQAARLAACDQKRNQTRIASILEMLKDDSQRRDQLS